MAGIYIHIPYCVKKCAYCDFVSFAEPESIGAYVELLKREIELSAKRLPMPERIETVFLGGGTPSLLSGAQMTAILDALRERYPIDADAEITTECNPGTATGDRLAAYRAAGVNRLSVGLQSADDGLLAAIGRIHTYARFLSTVQSAVDAGFTNINVDVMHGLPGQTEAQYLATLQAVCALEHVTHVSAYALILEPGTPLYRAVRAGRTALPDEDAAADMQDAGMAYLSEQGFLRYEISNFAKAGYACRHNLNYWKNGEYLGLGVAAHGAMHIGGVWTRRANVETVGAYAAALRANRLPVQETLTPVCAEEMFETVMLGLRTVRGVSLPAFFDRFGISLYDAYPDAVAQLRRFGWTIESEDTFSLNARGLDLQNKALLLFAP